MEGEAAMGSDLGMKTQALGFGVTGAWRWSAFSSLYSIQWTSAVVIGNEWS